jgi:phage terminase large subunit GpA-like protein
VTNLALTGWGCYTIRQDFGDNLVIEVDKANRPKMVRQRRVLHLRDQSNISIVKSFKHKASPEKRLNRSNNTNLHYWPVGFIKKTYHAIRARGFVKAKV